MEYLHECWSLIRVICGLIHLIRVICVLIHLFRVIHVIRGLIRVIHAFGEKGEHVEQARLEQIIFYGLDSSCIV